MFLTFTTAAAAAAAAAVVAAAAAVLGSFAVHLLALGVRVELVL